MSIMLAMYDTLAPTEKIIQPAIMSLSPVLPSLFSAIFHGTMASMHITEPPKTKAMAIIKPVKRNPPSYLRGRVGYDAPYPRDQGSTASTYCVSR